LAYCKISVFSVPIEAESKMSQQQRPENDQQSQPRGDDVIKPIADSLLAGWESGAFATSMVVPQGAHAHYSLFKNKKDFGAFFCLFH
jgi:hypothetical protein